MTESGNHGGSSYEETDSLALFIGLNNDISDYSLSTHNIIYQVDIAPTLALLFGVPIPKNNVGVLIAEIFGYLADDQQLKALELNSWQLLRLLQAQMPGLSCRNYLCDDFSDDQESKITKCSGSMGKMFCCLYTNAALLQNSWMSKEFSRSKSREDYSSAVTAYYEFLRTASEWLSRSATDKPVSLLTLGIAAMLLSCLILLSLLFNMCKEVYIREKYLFDLESAMQTWYLDETFVLGVILILIVSMISSSMVEEEQYIWHFVASTLNLLLLRKAIQCPPCGGAQGLHTLSKEQNKISCFRLSSIFVVLVSGRILRGWHQGGVNWTNLPDISKWLEQSGTDNVKSIQLVSCLLLMTLSLYVLFLLGSNKKFVLVIGFSFLMSGLLVLQHVTKHWEVAAFYFLGMAGHFALGNSNSLATIDVAGAFIGISSHSTVLSGILMFMITYASPMLFILSMVMYISVKETSYLPSPFSADSTQLLKIMLGFPCLVPLGLNSILLTAYTIILLLMRNHLFVWSVFSPKYIYVCTTTVCVYVGVSVVSTTVTYTYLVLGFRRKMQGELSHQQ
ncbi:GPI ethanolamine phosphate transferase 2 isoform X2 [Prunus yedoensis var. nudiflora]|uniref:GPI ethanolamine phosphate transferase 2 isoform X2 n=1 Tax=Prunus yedoensis var. nudiflora TaxID=2094558 RepID=A0A314ZLB2_PRUYE|nr:GPI ethanolamine phosphate transferase 2 isoform X2 [Prunus yedoensis var. nudiflora]